MKNRGDMDLYELLGVAKSATEDELKRAYKKQALKLHPDRNFDRVEEATALFAKVQAAYDVLSDPQERAWYDAHGLAGGFGSGFGAYDDDIGAGKVTTVEDLKRYFDPMLYQNTTDGPDGIYQIASSIFTRLAQEEAEAVFDQGLDGQFAELPKFGDSMSNWVRETKPFYDSWLGFASKKTFAWYDQYRLRDAPDRRTRRLMESQNQKARDAARKEFNETVRTLVSFVRKRDPRFKLRAKHTGATKMSAKAQANAAAREQAARDRKANNSNRGEYEEQEWEKIEEEEFNEFFSDDEKNKKGSKNEGDEADIQSGEEANGVADVESDEDILEVFECVVCDKIFKSRAHIVSHEQSKKHIKALQKLKWEMRQESMDLGLDGNEKQDSEEEEDDQVSDKEEQVQVPFKHKKQGAKVSFNVLMPDASEYGSETESDTPPEPVKAREFQPVAKSEEESVQDLLEKLEGTRVADQNDDEDDDWGIGKKKNKKKAKATKGKKSTPVSTTAFTAESHSSGPVNDDLEDGIPQGGKVGKAKQRRLKRAQQDDIALVCVVCKTEFTSRNKLFDHVKVSGHAAPVSGPRR